jgi:hypothetical protein
MIADMRIQVECNTMLLTIIGENSPFLAQHRAPLPVREGGKEGAWRNNPECPQTAGFSRPLDQVNVSRLYRIAQGESFMNVSLPREEFGR